MGLGDSMENISYVPLTIGTAVTGSSQVFIPMQDQLLLFIPALATWVGSATMAFRLQGSYASGTSAKTAYIYDYVNQTPKECAITITTGGMYELPYPGGMQQVRIEFDAAATKATSIYLVLPRAAY